MKLRKNKLKSIGIFALVLVLLTSVILPMTVAGSSVDGDAVTTYTVKAGDTLASIASAYGVTVSNIVSANGLSASSELFVGQVLKIPGAVSVEEDSTTTYAASSIISVDFKDADIEGALSAILAHTGYTMVYLGESTNVSISLDDVTPLTAIDYILRTVDMTYIKNDNIIYVGTASQLNSKFIDNKALTKVNLKYISVDTLVSQLSTLGVSLTVVKSDINLREFWVSAYPMELAKMHELINTLDKKENLTISSASISSNLTAIEMKHISASEFSSLLASLGLHEGIVMAAHPMTLYVYASGDAYNDIMRVKKLVDYLDPSAEEENNDKDSDKDSGKDSGKESGKDDKGTTSDVVISDGKTSLVKVDLQYITKTDVASIISTFGYDVEVLGLDLYEKRVWIRGESDEVNDAVSQIKENDIAANNTTMTYFTYELQNIVAAELQSKIAFVDVEGVQFYYGSYPEVTKSVMVACPTNRVDEVKDVISELDNNLGKIYYPIQTITDPSELDSLNAKEDLVVKFANIPSITTSVFGLSDDLDSSEEGVKYVLYVLESPENIDIILNLWQQF